MKIMPYLTHENGFWELYVDGKPFTALSGEVHNSSASNAAYMERDVWPYVKGLHLNTISFPVYWEQIEFCKGTYNFSVLDQILLQAREKQLKVVLLWFGLWKNGNSSYIPEWMKLSPDRFSRARNAAGVALDVISPFCEAAVYADQKAYCALLEHLKEIDQEAQTVICIQVENEIGLLGSDRDYSPKGTKVFESSIPKKLADLYKMDTKYNFTEAFGEKAPEILMEYAYANAIQKIASAGRKVYPLPVMVNAWVAKYPWVPGTYPSGGPIAEYHFLWKALAPSVDILAPDLYASDLVQQFEEYTKEDNPLAIPEFRRDVRYISSVFYAIGKYNALCFAPFGIEDFAMPPECESGLITPSLLKTLNIGGDAFNCEGTVKYLAESYRILKNCMDLMRECRIRKSIYAFMRQSEHDRGAVIWAGQYEFQIAYQDKDQSVPQSAGIVLQISDNEFYVMGCNVKVQIRPKSGPNVQAAFLSLEEGNFEDNQFIAERNLNGDERYFLLLPDIPHVIHMKLFQYE